MKIKKRDSNVILNALYGGVVPNRGLQHIMVGRTKESERILTELEQVKMGSSLVKFFIGPFGSGKTFIQSLISQIAFKQNFVVSKVDFTPLNRLYGSEGKAVLTYTGIIKNISIKTVPEGNALPTILDKWISDVQTKVSIEKNYGAINFDDQNFVADVEKEIVNVVSKMDELTGGYDFSRILVIYFKAFIDSDALMMRNAIRWLSGEYTTKTEARSDLGVRDIIKDSNYYEYIKVLSQFVKQIGYSGIVINFDEAINLYKITHPQTRDKNYEMILKIYNDTLQGRLEGIYFTFGGTPEFLEDERRGMFSYNALKTRIVTNKYETENFRDLSQPVIKLTPLNHEENFVLLKKLRDIHGVHYNYDVNITDDEIMEFIKKAYSVLGAEANMTTRDIVKDFLGALNIMNQNEDFDKSSIFGTSNTNVKSHSIDNRFVSNRG